MTESAERDALAAPLLASARRAGLPAGSLAGSFLAGHGPTPYAGPGIRLAPVSTHRRP